MARPSIYSVVVTAIAIVAWLYIGSLSTLPAGWDAIMGKLVEMTPEAIWAFFDNNHQIIVRLVWVVLIAHVAITVFPPLGERLNPRWYSHLAVVSLIWLAFFQTTFAPPNVHPPAKEASSVKTPVKPRHP